MLHAHTPNHVYLNVGMHRLKYLIIGNYAKLRFDQIKQFLKEILKI